MSRLCQAAQLGLTLVEVLVTLLIFSIGLLGYAGLQGRVQISHQDVYSRVYAINILTIMLDHIRANSRARECYQLNKIELGTGYGNTFRCSSGVSTEAQQQAEDSINAWSALLQGEHATQGEKNIGGLLNAQGCIEFDSASTMYVVTVVWQGITEASPTESSCGKGIYGGASNRLRRLVSGAFYVPDLQG